MICDNIKSMLEGERNIIYGYMELLKLVIESDITDVSAAAIEASKGLTTDPISDLLSLLVDDLDQQVYQFNNILFASKIFNCPYTIELPEGMEDIIKTLIENIVSRMEESE